MNCGLTIITRCCCRQPMMTRNKIIADKLKLTASQTACTALSTSYLLLLILMALTLTRAINFTYFHFKSVMVLFQAKAKAKARHSYIALLTGQSDQPRFTIIGSGSWSARVNGAAALMRPSIERANEQSDPRQQLANTSPPQSTTPGLYPVSIHQMAPPERTSDCSSFIETISMKGWVGLVGWRTIYPYNWSLVRWRSSPGQGKFAGQRPTFYHCATPPTKAELHYRANFH